MTWTVGRKLYAATLMMVATLATLGLVAIESAGSLNATAVRLAKQRAKSILVTGDIERGIPNLQASTRLVILAAISGDSKMVDSKAKDVQEEFGDVFAAAASLKGLSKDPKVHALCDRITGSMQAFQAHAIRIVALARAGDTAGAATVNIEARGPSKDAEAAAADIRNLQEQKLTEDEDAAAAAYRAALQWTTAIFVLGVAVAVVVFFVVRGLTRSLGRVATDLKEGAVQVASAAEQVSDSAQSLSQGSTEQAASLEETSASMEEMASMTRQNAENSQEAARLMSEADTLVDGCNRSIAEMVQSMTTIRQSSDKVSAIIKAIDEIAFQTNILALNAAVEAARAGEAGMGFAVVAEEVRNLAQRSAQAARDTAVLIDASTSDARDGTAKVEGVGRSIEAVTNSLRRVNGLVRQVSDASRQQSDGIAQVTQAVAQMEKVTQSTAATAEESAASSEELSAQAETTLAIVAELDAMVVARSADGREPKRSARATVARHVPRAAAKAPMRAAAAGDREEHLAATGTFGRF